jgi:hypothetical protein
VGFLGGRPALLADCRVISKSGRVPTYLLMRWTDLCHPTLLGLRTV